MNYAEVAKVFFSPTIYIYYPVLWERVFFFFFFLQYNVSCCSDESNKNQISVVNSANAQ